MSRKDIKDSKKAKCSYTECRKNDPFKKRLGYYYKGKYYCGKNCVKKQKEDKIDEERK